MSSIWKTIPLNVPTDNQLCYCRAWENFGQAFQATYQLAAQTFTDVDNGIVFPAYIITRWRPA